MSFRPLQDRVLIRRVEQEQKTAGGIIIPDTAKEKPMEGEIVAAAPGRAARTARSIRSTSRWAIASSSASGREPRSRSMAKSSSS